MSGAGSPPARWCASCGRAIEWRARWADTWDEIRYCSAACRRRRVRASDRALEDAITGLLSARARDATICPSEAARAVGGDEWRGLMDDARAAARRLVVAGRVEIVQRGRVVDPSTAKGPIRVRARPVAPVVPRTGGSRRRSGQG